MTRSPPPALQLARRHARGRRRRAGATSTAQVHLAAPLSTERLLPGPDGLVRIALKKAFSDGSGHLQSAGARPTRSRCSPCAQPSNSAAIGALNRRGLGEAKPSALAPSSSALLTMPLDGVAVVAFGNELSGCLPNAFLCEAGRYARVRAGPRDAALAQSPRSC